MNVKKVSICFFIIHKDLDPFRFIMRMGLSILTGENEKVLRAIK